MEPAIAAYHAWRASLSADDQARWKYLLGDGEPLLVDVIRAAIDAPLRTSGVFGGLEAGLVDSMLADAGSAALKALQA